MGKYINSIKELVANAIYDSESLNAAVSQKDAKACFQMGMICLLGVISDVDFSKAKQYLGDSSLAMSDDALRLLGFIAECEGNIGDAFNSYVKAFDSDGKNTNVQYFDKVIKQREILSKEFDSLNLKGVELNNNITRLLDFYKKRKLTKTDIFVLLAMVQKDETSCLDAANYLLEEGNAYSAKRWFEKSGVGNSNPLYSKIENKINESKLRLNLPAVPQVIELESTNLANITENALISTLYDSVSEDMGSYYTSLWKDVASQKVTLVKKNLDAEEKEKKKEQARLRMKKEEENALLRQQQEENSKLAKQNRTKRNIDIFLAVIFSPFVLVLIAASMQDKNELWARLFVLVFALAIAVVLPFMVLRWIIRKIFAFFGKL